MQKIIRAFYRAVLCCAAANLLAGCAAGRPADGGKLQISATLFPQYDFARQIAGEYADVSLLLTPGVESHSFEPTPADIVQINQADLFLYTGRYMEPWAQRLIDGADAPIRAVDLSQGITLDAEGAEGHEGHGHEAREEHGGFDPHIWTSPVNAKVMVGTIADALIEADPAHAGAYRANAGAYLQKLDALDRSLRQTVETAKRRELVFGGRFALHYFAEEYGLEYEAAFDSCSSETEPSVGVMIDLIDDIRAKGIPAIYYEELTDPKVARAIAGETGVKMLLLHSCHNVSRQELDSGATYLSLMEQNLENLKEGLN